MPPLPQAGDVGLADWLGSRAIDRLIASLGPDGRFGDLRSLRDGEASAGHSFVTVKPGESARLPAAELVAFEADGDARWRSLDNRFAIVADGSAHQLYRMHGPVPIPVGDRPDASFAAARRRASGIAGGALLAAWSHLAKAAGVELYREVLVRLASTGRRAFRTASWPEPNVLFHLRLSTRRIEHAGTVRRALHVEELHSDWHADGARYGTSEDPESEKAAVCARIQELLSEACDLGTSLGLDRAVSRRDGAPPATRRESGEHFLLMCDDSFHTGIHSNGDEVAGHRHAEIKITDAVRAAVAGSRLPLLRRRRAELAAEIDRLDRAPPPAPFALTWLDLAIAVALAEAARTGCEILAVSTAAVARSISPIDELDLERPPESFELLYDREVPAALERLSRSEVRRTSLGEGRVANGVAISGDLRSNFGAPA